MPIDFDDFDAFSAPQNCTDAQDMEDWAGADVAAAKPIWEGLYPSRTFSETGSYSVETVVAAETADIALSIDDSETVADYHVGRSFRIAATLAAESYAPAGAKALRYFGARRLDVGGHASIARGGDPTSPTSRLSGLRLDVGTLLNTEWELRQGSPSDLTMTTYNDIDNVKADQIRGYVDINAATVAGLRGGSLIASISGDSAYHQGEYSQVLKFAPEAWYALMYGKNDSTHRAPMPAPTSPVNWRQPTEYSYAPPSAVYTEPASPAWGYFGADMGTIVYDGATDVLPEAIDYWQGLTPESARPRSVGYIEQAGTPSPSSLDTDPPDISDVFERYDQFGCLDATWRGWAAGRIGQWNYSGTFVVYEGYFAAHPYVPPWRVWRTTGVSEVYHVFWRRQPSQMRVLAGFLLHSWSATDLPAVEQDDKRNWSPLESHSARGVVTHGSESLVVSYSASSGASVTSGEEVGISWRRLAWDERRDALFALGRFDDDDMRLYRSYDAGATLEEILAVTSQSGAIAAISERGALLTVYTDAGGLIWRRMSWDGGDNWESAEQCFAGEIALNGTVWDLTHDARRDSLWMVVMVDKETNDFAYYKSTDLGLQWTVGLT